MNSCTPIIKPSYTYEELLLSGKGELFGEKGPQLPAPPMLMMDRIIEMNQEKAILKKGILKLSLILNRIYGFLTAILLTIL